jgi:hypothetical protein
MPSSYFGCWPVAELVQKEVVNMEVDGIQLPHDELDFFCSIKV